MGVVLAWALLSEELAGIELAGIFLTIGCLAWVLAERHQGASSLPDVSPRYYLVGVLFGLGGALGQASGLILSKQGLEGDFSALSGNLMRLIASTSLIWLLAIAAGKARSNFQALQAHPRAIRLLIGGAIAGPFIGVWLSLIAVQNAPVGIASTLMSLTPVILLPLGRIFFNETISRRAIGGTLVAMIGTAILFLA